MAIRSSRRKTALTVLSSKIYELALAKLATSDLTIEDAQALGIEILSPEQTQALGIEFPSVSSLKLNYLHPLTAEPLLDHLGGEPFFRVRTLEPSTDLADQGTSPRYLQSRRSVPVAYYPIGYTAWAEVLNDIDRPLIITEGELKAACASKHGFPTIGLGGVWSFRSLNAGVTWLDSLNLPVWLGRRVYIAFDSDYVDNRQVHQALLELARQLTQRGAFVHLASIPALEGFDKTGLDDLLVTQGTSLFSDLLHQAPPLGLTEPLMELNRSWVYVADPGLLINTKTHSRVSPNAWTTHVAAKEEYMVNELLSNGETRWRPVSAADAWLSWPLRSQVNRLTYAPGQSTFLTTKGLSEFNIWQGWGVVPQRGNVKPFMELVRFLLGGCDSKQQRWLLQWFAYPLQHPGAKLYTYVALWGRHQGTGKTLLGELVGRIYGTNFVRIKQHDLHASFNEWAQHKQFAMGDDVTSITRREDAEYLKTLITQTAVTINAKYLPTYVLPDCLNYYFTANQPDMFFLEDDDRRAFVIESTEEALPDKFYDRVAAWRDGDGIAALFYHLLNLDLTGFNPFARAPLTDAKAQMIDEGRSDLAAWVRQVVDDPDTALRLGTVVAMRDLWTAAELLHLYDPDKRHRVTAPGMGRELRRASVLQVAKGQTLRVPGQPRARYFILRNQERWLRATVATAQAYLAKQTK